MSLAARALLRASPLTHAARRHVAVASSRPRFAAAVRGFASQPQHSSSSGGGGGRGISTLIVALLSAGAGAAGYHYFLGVN
ncbi:hypothetical protein EDD11_007878, partial [Mortierella claussenii]